MGIVNVSKLPRSRLSPGLSVMILRTEYVGCNIEWTANKNYVRFTQPVLRQSYQDEFEIESKPPMRTPIEMGKVLVKWADGTELSIAEHTNYCQWVGKFLHMMRWLRPEIYNATMELSRFMTLGASTAHMKALIIVMGHCVATEKRNKKFHGDPDFKLVILGRSDSDSAKDPDTRRSVSGNSMVRSCRGATCRR
jgi:hypothetical protein